MRTTSGFTLVEVLAAAVLVALASMAGVAYVTRGSQHADWTRDKVFARQKALSILAELRAYVEGGEGEVAADLDGFDDGLRQQAHAHDRARPRRPPAARGARPPALGQHRSTPASGAGTDASPCAASRAS